MNDSTPPAPCPRCGAPLPADAPEGLCPRCLAALQFGPETELPEEPKAAPAPPVPPDELAPHFPQLEILECLGRGGMGVVYKTRQKSLNRLAALKLLAPERAQDGEFAKRFTREAHALAAMNHPHIVTVYDFGRAGGFYFLLMEYVDGVNLRQALNAKRFTPEQALAVVPPVCEALQYAHEHGIVHRDIKPENLLLDKEGRVKIADFGIAKMLGDNSNAGLADSQPAGTPQYMAPEQKEHQRADHRADIYSLGVVLYEMLTGERPADKIEPPSRRVQVDVRIDEIVLRALEKAPEMRYQTAAEMRTHLETIADLSRSARQSPSAGAQPSLLPPALVFAAVCLANVCYLAATAAQLPERPAVHFDIDGTPNGWMNHSTYLLVTGAIPLVFVALFCLLAQGVKWFPFLINIPRRDYWLAPERRTETALLLLRRLLWLGSLETAFFGGIHALVLKANSVSPPRLPSGPLLVLVTAFLLVLMMWIITLLMRLAEAEHGTKRGPRISAAGAAKPAAGIQGEAGPMNAAQRFFHTIGFRHRWSQRWLVLSLPGFLGFLGCIPCWEAILPFLWLFAFLIVASLVERVTSRSEPAGPPGTSSYWRRQWFAVLLVVAIAIAAPVLLVGQYYVVIGRGAAPEIPLGSRILVRKISRSFAPGDLVAYREEGLGDIAYQQGGVSVGRVVRADGNDITVNRHGELDETLPRSRVVGKVISVYWRGTSLISSPVSGNSGDFGIGIVLAENNGHLLISSTVPNTPASEDGRLQPGDEIISFGDSENSMHPVAGRSARECGFGTRGQPGSPLALRVIPAGKSETDAYQLTLARRLMPVIEWDRLGQLGSPLPRPTATPEPKPVMAVQAYRGDIGVWLYQVGTVIPPRRRVLASPSPPKDNQPPPTPAGLQDAWVTLLFAIPENYVQTVVKKLDAKQQLSVEAYDPSSPEKLLATGFLTSVDNQIDAATGTLPCKAVVQPKADALLYPNLSVLVHLLAETKAGVTLVPASALQFSTNGAVVHVIDAEGRTSARRVTVGVRDRERYEITDGLAPGEVVVPNPDDQMRDGMRLRYQVVSPESLETQRRALQRPDASPTPRAAKEGAVREAAGDSSANTTTNPENAARLSAQGWQLWQSGQLSEAEAKFSEAVRLAPSDANAWNGLGWASFNSGKTGAAEEAFQKVISLEPNHAGALNGLGQIYLSQREYEKAEPPLLKAAAQQGASAAWFGLARLYLIEGKYEDAEKWVQQFVDSGQGDAIATKMLEAAKEKRLSEGLRQTIEPPMPAKAKSETDANRQPTPR